WSNNGFEHAFFLTTAVPEPGVLSLLGGLGVTGSVFFLRRRKRRSRHPSSLKRWVSPRPGFGLANRVESEFFCFFRLCPQFGTELALWHVGCARSHAVLLRY